MDEKINLTNWHAIAELTDKNVLGLEGMSNKPPRKTTRAIIVDENGNYAVLYAKKHDLYSLPGGGIEEGEDEISALKREIDEETGLLVMQYNNLVLYLKIVFIKTLQQSLIILLFIPKLRTMSCI